MGHARLAYDLDGPARRYVPFVQVAGRVVPSLPLAAVIEARGIAPEHVSASRAALMLDGLRVPWVEEVVPDYYGPAPLLNDVAFRFYPDVGAALAGYAAGEVLGISRIDAAHLTRTFRRMMGTTPSDLAFRRRMAAGSP